MADYEDDRVKVWAFAARRGRDSMEDQHFVSTNLPGNRTLVGVFDGHAGAEAARFCSRVFTRYLLANPAYSAGDFAAGLHQTFMQMDRLLRGSRCLLDKLAIPLDSTGEEDEIDIDFDLITEEPGFGEIGARFVKYHPYQAYVQGGTTATVALILDKRVIVANAGDSYCCIVRDGEMVNLTLDHHQGVKGDDARVERAGGVFSDEDGYLFLKGDPEGRSYGGLNMTRSLGDVQLKMNKGVGFEHQALSPVPDIVELDLIRRDEYLMLASDGVSRSYAHGWRDIVKMCEKKEAGQGYEFRPPYDDFFPDNATLLAIELKLAPDRGEVDAKPVRRFSWFTENKIEGYESEEVEMLPWKLQRDRCRWSWIDEVIPELSAAEKDALRDYIEVKFCDEDAAAIAGSLKQQFEGFKSADAMRSSGDAIEMLARVKASREGILQHLKAVGHKSWADPYLWITEFFLGLGGPPIRHGKMIFLRQLLRKIALDFFYYGRDVALASDDPGRDLADISETQLGSLQTSSESKHESSFLRFSDPVLMNAALSFFKNTGLVIPQTLGKPDADADADAAIKPGWWQHLVPSEFEKFWMESSGDLETMPWFRGRPLPDHLRELAGMKSEICPGQGHVVQASEDFSFREFFETDVNSGRFKFLLDLDQGLVFFRVGFANGKVVKCVVHVRALSPGWMCPEEEEVVCFEIDEGTAGQVFSPGHLAMLRKAVELELEPGDDQSVRWYLLTGGRLPERPFAETRSLKPM